MSRITKIGTGVALIIAIVAVYVIVSHAGSNDYKVNVMLADAGGLESGSDVNVDGATVGRVKSLSVTKNDQAEAVLALNKNAAPIGAGATATVEIDGFFGERLVQLNRGDYKTHPEQSGTATIPVRDSHVSVRLDDVLDSLNASAQGALRTFLDEEGVAIVGRGTDIEQTLAQLPQTLPALTTLMDQFSSNQQALGQLVERSDQVVSQLAPQRQYLTSLVNSGNSALSALASRRDDLGSTVDRAPGALKQAQSTLATLQGTAIPLAPASDGLRATAPALLNTLKEVPAFTKAAIPTLNEVAAVAPALQRLGAYGTPIVGQIQPLTRELTTYTGSGLEPLLTMLDSGTGAENMIGLMEGWARSTQGYDGSGHIFRFGATASAQTLASLLTALDGASGLTPSKSAAPSKTAAPSTSTGSSGSGGSSSAPDPVRNLGGTVSSTLNNVGGAVSGVVKNLGGAVSSTLNNVGSSLHGGKPSSRTSTSSSSTGSGLSSLLGYLTGS